MPSSLQLGSIIMLCLADGDAPSSEEDEDLADWRDRAHEGATQFDEHRIQYPFRGLPDLGTVGQRRPPASKKRSDHLKKGMMVAVNMKGEEHPLSIGKILYLFVDTRFQARWMRVHWWEPLQNRFRGTYRANPQGPSFAGNLLLTPVSGIGKVVLIHWSGSRDRHPVLTAGFAIREETLKLARVDVRLTDPAIQLKLQ